MSEWWDRYLFDDLIGLEAAAVTSDGSRHIGPFVRFGDYLTVDDTCVFTRKDKGDGVRLMEEVDHVRLRPEEPFWQGRFLDELEGVRVRVEFGGRRGAFEGPLEPFDGVLGLRAGGRGMEYVFGDSGYRFAQPGFVKVRPVEDQPDEPVPAINASRLIESRTLLRVARTNALNKLHDKIAGLRFLDPACGSGNFLTETYLELRRIENRILADLDKDGQLALDLGDDLNPVRVSISHFHGIEINGFACAVARTALWIAEQQALDDTESTISGLPRLPFTDTAHIQQGNALRLDWNELLPGDHCDYVMGNPPFIGHVTKTAGQTDDLKTVWGRQYDGYLDYATGWYRKAASYLSKPDAAFAFVTTNSITQGQPVEPLFKPLHADGWHIRFAHRTFAWDAQSTDNAHVHVVIIGLDRKAKPAPVLFEYADINGEPTARTVDNINGYLIDGPDLYVGKRSQKTGPVSPLLDVTDSGSMPLDGGNLLLADREEYDRAMADPIAARFVRPFRMGRELINGTDRWCLWLRDAEPGELRKSSFLKKRVDACAEYRRNAPMKGDAYKHRATPWLFRDDHQPSTNYLAIPKVFSEDREYMTCDWYTPDIIAGDMVYTSPDRDGLAFAVIESRMFMTWQQTIGGRLESRCRFSNTVVWNNLPLPALDDETRTALIEAGRNVLAARANHPGQSLADLYDPDYMPTDLRAAHRELDKVADVAFGAGKWLKDDDDTRLQVLFKSYTRMTGSSEV